MKPEISYGPATRALAPNPPARDAYTIALFCWAHHVSRTHFYELLKQGKGPRLMKVGRRTLVSAEAAADWRKRMEAETAAAHQSTHVDLAKVVR